MTTLRMRVSTFFVTLAVLAAAVAASAQDAPTPIPKATLVPATATSVPFISVTRMLEARYGSYKNYAAKVSASIDKLANDRWVTAADAQRIREELLAPPAPAGGMANTSGS